MTAAAPSLPPEITRQLTASPIDVAISGLIAWFGSAEFTRRMTALAEREGAEITVSEFALIVAAPAEAIECWLARDLALIVGEPVRALLSQGHDGPVAVEYRPYHRGTA